MDLLPNDLLYQGWKNHCIVIAQRHFKRTFCHCSDLMDGVLFGIKNFEIMKNELFNVGTDRGNWSKEELALFIQKITGCSLYYDDSIYFDTDHRSYLVNYSKLNTLGFETKISIENGLKELLKA